MILEAAESWRSAGRFAMQVVLPLMVLAVVSGLFFDQKLAAHFRPLFGSPMHVTAIRATDVGRAEIYFALAGLGFLAGFVLQKRAVWVPSTYALASLLVSGALVQALKHIVGRQRPYADPLLSGTSFNFFVGNYEWHSFPSGHSQVGFTVAAFLMAFWPRLTAVWILFASAVAMTRVMTLNHWLSDTFAGAAVGLLGTVLAFRLMAKTKLRLS